MAAKTGPSGYDCNFITEPDDALKCLICQSVAKDPRQHDKCGKLFCKECIERYVKHKPCPNCKKIGGQFYKDHKSKRDISELKVKCDNVEKKCKWTGIISTLEEHVATCEFALLPCPKECKGDNNEVKNFLRTDHVQRQSIDKHPTTERKYTCKYQSLGCTREMNRKHMAAHEKDDKFHLHMAIDMTVKLKQDLEDKIIELQRDLDDKTSKLERDLENVKRDIDNKTSKLERYLENARPGITNSELIKLKLTDFKKRRKYSEQVTSPSYYITPNGYLMAIRVYANGHGVGKGTYVSVFAHILKGRYDAELKWPFTRKITFTLLNQLEDKNHYQRITDVTAADKAQAGGSEWGYQKFIPHSELGPSWFYNIQYLKDDTLYFRMSVQVADHKPWLE